MTRDQIDGLVQREALIPIERGVYRVAGGAISRPQAAMAAVLRSRPNARVTGPFVLGLFDVDGFTTEDPFEILRQPDRRMRGVDFPHRRDPFPSEARARYRGLPIVDVTTAILDAAMECWEIDERRLRVGFDSARWRGLTHPERLRERASALSRHHSGARFFLDLDLLRALDPESEPERAMGGMLQRFDPAPESQVWVTPHRRVDWFVRVLRLALEYLGDIDHATAEARRADRERDGELSAAGVRTVAVVARDLRDEHEFLSWMQHVFAARAHELGVDPPRLTG